MKELLEAVRQDAEVVKAAAELEHSVTAVDVCGSGDAWSSFFADKEAYDTALLRSVVRVLAARVREEADSQWTFAHHGGFLRAADFIERQVLDA